MARGCSRTSTRIWRRSRLAVREGASVLPLAPSMTYEERVAGCFLGLATGDAIGKQTETLSRADVRKWYPAAITGFVGQPGDIIPRYRGKRYEWRIGETTDDT